MKIGIICDAYKLPGESTRDYPKFKRHGYDCIDCGLMVDPNGIYYKMSEDELKKTLTEERKRVIDAGLEISQVHSTWPGDDSCDEAREAKKDLIRRTIRAAGYLEGKYIVIHPTRMYDKNSDEAVLEYNEKFYREMCAYAKDYGVGVCIENMPFGNFALSSVRQVVDFVKDVNIPGLSICYDTGHAWLFQERPADAVKMCGDLLTTLHVHDTDGVQDRHWLPFRGTIPWAGFGKALHEIGFKGTLSIETDARDYTKYPPELLEYHEIGLAQTAKYLTEC